MTPLNQIDPLSIIGKEGERKSNSVPSCFGTAKVLELASDIQCDKCDDWKYRCIFQYNFSRVSNVVIDYKVPNHEVEE